MSEMPTGTVTFLFTDVEASTRLWEEHPDAMQEALERHDAILRTAIEEHGGYVFSTAGDAFAAAFARAENGIAAAGQAQRDLDAEDWPDAAPIRVRMGLHSGESQERDGNYFGPPLNRAARLMSAANGGQVVLSAVTAELVRARLPQDLVLRDLGEHRLKDLSQPQRIFSVTGGGIREVRLPLRTVDGMPGNLPALLPRFIGRDAELASLLDATRAHRLVTVVGPPGTGKTRIAIQAVAEVAPDFAGGVWLIDLSAEHTTDDVTSAAARALSVAADPGMSLPEALADFLRYRPAVVVFDNCEGVLVPARTVMERLLQDCPPLSILATSREPLHGRIEYIFPLGPLEGGGAEAVALFKDRALSEGSTAEQLEDEDAIAELCTHLDGLPLAIELAAARARSIAPRQMLTLLGERFRLLKTGRHDADARHQTLLAAIDWSYELLGDTERALFDRLSLFAGPFETADAFAVAGDGNTDELDILDGLSDLVDRSLVVAVQGHLPTYRLLETLRVYGRDRMQDSSELTSLRRRLAEHLVAKAEAARAKIVGPNHVAVLDALVSQIGDYRAATAWALDEEDLDLAVSLAATFCGVTYFRIGYEALDWLGADPANLAQAGRPHAAEILGMLSRRAIFSGDRELGRSLAEQSIALDPGPASVQARGQLALAGVADADMSPLEWATSALEVAEEGDDQLGVLLGRLLLGPMLAGMGRVDEALDVGEQLLAQGETYNSDHAKGWGRWVLGLALSRRAPEQSREHLQLAVQLGQSEKNRYLESNARLAELEAALSIDDPATTATAALETLRGLEDGADNGYFTRSLLARITGFLASQRRPEAAKLDSYLRGFSVNLARTAGARGRAAALEALDAELGEEALAGLREAGSRMTAEEANRAAVTALEGIIAS